MLIIKTILTSDDGYIVTLAHESIELSNNSSQSSFKLPITVKNPNGDRVAIGVAFKARVANQKATGSFRFIESPID